MTWVQALIGIAAGFAAGVLSGAFGVGGGIITTPVVHLLLGGSAIEAVATPLPVIFPSAVTGAATYNKERRVNWRAVGWAFIPGGLGAVVGALITAYIDPHMLLLVTSALLAAQGLRIGWGGPFREHPHGQVPGWQYALAGAAAGFVSGVLGLGGGIVFVPILTVILGMPLKTALGTSLAVIAVVVIPGTFVHTFLDHINWPAFIVLVIGVIPGARIGAKLALRANEKSLRRAVGVFMLTLAIGYGSFVIWQLIARPS